MKTIYKYALPDGVGHYTWGFGIPMPEGADIIAVQYQPGSGPCLWAIVDKDKPVVTRRFGIIGTGWEIPEGEVLIKYLGTWQSNGFVWHLFGEG
jgi:hypothetical protein